MNKKQITGLILTVGLLAGAYGVSAMADESTNTTTQTQTGAPTLPENANRGFGNFMGMMRGGGNGNFSGMMSGGNGCGFGGGFFGADLTVEEQKELNDLRAEAQNIMVDYREEQLDLRESLTTAIEAGQQDDIVSAWDALSAFHEEIQLKLEPVQTKISAIVGSDTETFMGGRFEDSYLTEQIEALKSTTGEEAAQIIEDLQNLGGRGMRFNDNTQNGRGRGRGGRMMNPGGADQNNRSYRGNGL